MRVGARQRLAGTGWRKYAVLAALLFSAGMAALEFWSSPPGWLLPARHITVRGLHWLHQHLLNAIGITALGTLSLALLQLLPGWLDRRRVSLTANQQAQQRRVMLQRVAFSLYGAAAFAFTVFAAGTEGQLREERTMPNEGIRRSAKHALILGLVWGLIVGLGIALINNIGINVIQTHHISGTSPAYFRFSTRLLLSLATGLAASLFAGVLLGGAGCLHHYVVRATLVRAGVAPWRYQRYLDAMVERLLLRRAGNGYLFAHRMLRDYLAKYRSDLLQ